MNKQDVMRELNVAIKFYESIIKERDGLGYVHVDEENTALSALKFMGLMMKPSDAVIEAVFNEYGCYGTITAEFAIKAAVKQGIKEIQNVGS